MADISLEGGQKDLPIEPVGEADEDSAGEDSANEETLQQGTGVGEAE